MIISILKGWMTWITVCKVLHYRVLLEEFLSLLVPLFGLPLFFLPFLFCFGFLSVQAVSIGVVMREWWTGGPVRGVKIFSPSRRCRCSDSQEQRELRFCHPRDPSHGNWGGEQKAHPLWPEWFAAFLGQLLWWVFAAVTGENKVVLVCEGG